MPCNVICLFAWISDLDDAATMRFAELSYLLCVCVPFDILADSFSRLSCTIARERECGSSVFV